MTASEASFIGLAKQVGKGTINSTDASFKYFLFTEGQAGPQNSVIPLDQEVGGGAMLRGMAKVGVVSAGAFTIIPRPEILGHFLLGAIGTAEAPVQQGATTAYLHEFVMGTNQFDAPYFTVRNSPGSLWGETYRDCRISGLSLAWRAADYLRGQVSFFGGLPTPNVSTTTWEPLAKVDGGPQFLAPLFTMEVPDGTAMKVLSGAMTFGMQVPLEEQWITGSYYPDDFEINNRAFSLTLVVKATSAELYNKMSYDPANGAAWTADLFREADIDIKFVSDIDAGTGYPYQVQILANGESGDTSNVLWSCTPISMAAGRQLTFAVTGMFVADPSGAIEPITVNLINQKSTAY